MLRPFLVVATLAAVSAGCTQQTDIGGPCAIPQVNGNPRFPTGGSPCREQFYFPTGLAVDPDGDALYVASSNADLRYSGGVVAAVDVNFFECALQFACNGYAAPAPGPAAAAFAARCHATVDEFAARCAPYMGALAASIHNYDPAHGTGCRPDLLDPTIIECDEEPFIVDAVRTGNFSGSLRVQSALQPVCGAAAAPSPAPTGAATRRLWLPVRGDPSITYVDVRKSTVAAPIQCASSRSSPVCLDCGIPGSANPTVDPNNGDPAHIPNSCDAQRITVHDFHQPDAPGSACASDATACVGLAPDPFGITLDQGCTNRDQPYSRLLVLHLLGGEVDLIDASVAQPVSTVDQPRRIGDPPVVLDVRGNFFPADSFGRRGGFALQPRVPGDPLSYWYATSRIDPIVGMFRIAEANLLLPAGSFAVSGGPYAFGADIRDLAFDPCVPIAPGCRGSNAHCAADADCCSVECLPPDAAGLRRCGPGNQGCRAFFVDDNPPSLFTADTRVDPRGVPAGVPRNQVVDIVDICQGPSHLALRRIGVAAGERPLTRVYVVCFNAGQVQVVDPDLARLVDTILVGKGPNEIAFNFGPGLPAPAHLRAYVTEYLDMNVAVVDLDPGSPRENRVIGRIGLTQPATVH